MHLQNYLLQYYYQKDNSTLEMDFFIRSKDYLIPVEVKAKSGKAKSLTAMIQSDHYEDISFGIKLSYGNIGFSNGYYNFPYFCTFLLKEFIRIMDDSGSLKVEVINKCI